jgi:hypothetical protein
MDIINCTPHAINIIDNATFNSDLRKWTTSNPNIVATIPSSGVVSAKIDAVDLRPINGIPVMGKTIVGVDPLPEGDDAIYVVSALYASAYRTIHGNVERLYTVSDPVYSEDGRTILGSRGICPMI